jgi:glycyl-tRNA synthetase beta chain
LLEIGTQELPAIPFLTELPNILTKYNNILTKYNLFSESSFYYTPRRLVFMHKNFKDRQDDNTKKIFGPPLSIAFKDNSATKVGLGFAKKCGVDIENIQTDVKNGKEVLCFTKTEKGELTKDIFGNIVTEFLESLSFGKSMRWNNSNSFIRPIEWITAILGEDVLRFSSFGVESSNFTYPHRDISYNSVAIKSMCDYSSKLTSLGIILDQNMREKIILNEFKEIENKNNIEISLDRDLLDHVVAITEHPKPILGEFDNLFLELPKEVISTSMKEHQKYFTVSKDDKITNKFVVISNSLSSSDNIINGNQKVLIARLQDAMFFFENDKKNRLSNDGLEKIIFADGLGTLLDKLNRETKIAILLSGQLNENEVHIREAMEISKSDLLSQMVYEFTDLQGIMGYYYAIIEGKSQKIATSIKEQYLPAGTTQLPSSIFSSIIAIANKLDSILSLFSINKIPSGTKDPFALRRNAIGIIRIVLKHDIPFDILNIIDILKVNYKSIDACKIDEFFCERLYQIFDVNPSIISAVLANKNRDLIEIKNKILALDKFSKNNDFHKLISTFKRVANIVKDMNFTDVNINEDLFVTKFEHKLFNEFITIKKQNISNYEDKLNHLLTLRTTLDEFFENVMVNDNNQTLKTNRKNLIANIYLDFLKIANIKNITF